MPGVFVHSSVVGTRERPGWEEWSDGTTRLTLCHERCYKHGSADNTQTYSRQYLPGNRRESPQVQYGVRTSVQEVEVASVVLLGKGFDAPYVRSAIVLEDRCYIAISSSVFCLLMPSLDLEWEVEADPVSAGGLHLLPAGDSFIVHGELEITRMALSGDVIWKYSGREIFYGELTIEGAEVLVYDWDNYLHRIRLDSGSGEAFPPEA